MKKSERGKKLLFGIFKFLIIPLLLLLLTWRFAVGWLLLILARTIQKTHKKGYLIKDKKGDQVKTKEFFKRWKDGIEGITPLQQTKTSIMGTWIVISGTLGGIIVNFIVRMQNEWWWIEIILFGALILTVIQFVGTLQKYWRQKEIAKHMENLK